MGYTHLSNTQISKAKSLRSHGHSFSEISQHLNISKNTVIKYVKDVVIRQPYIKKWVAKRGGSRIRKESQETKAYQEGLRLVKNLNTKEKLLFTAALYWAEGNKKDFILTNTDPNLIKVFIGNIREIFQLKDTQIKVSIRIYEDLNVEECLKFWSRIVKIPPNKFLATNILKGKKIGKLQYGMCRVRVIKGADLLKKLMGINKAISNQKIYTPIAQMDRAPRS